MQRRKYPTNMDMGDYFTQYEDDGAPADSQDILSMQAQVRDMSRQQQAPLEMLQRHVQPQGLQATEQDGLQQVPAGPVPLFPQGQSQEKLPEPPSLGSDDAEDDNKITSKMYSIHWLKVQMWIALVEGRISPQRYPALIANRLKGKAADPVWLGGREALTKERGLTLI